ncbi:MAG TPA: hypothetical protein VII19_07855, partial [Acidimicrobiales bacterium]
VFDFVDVLNKPQFYTVRQWLVGHAVSARHLGEMSLGHCQSSSDGCCLQVGGNGSVSDQEREASTSLTEGVCGSRQKG